MNQYNQNQEERKPSFIEVTLAELKEKMKSTRDFQSLYRDVPAYVELKLKESFKNGMECGAKKAKGTDEKKNFGQKFFKRRTQSKSNY